MTQADASRGFRHESRCRMWSLQRPGGAPCPSSRLPTWQTKRGRRCWTAERRTYPRGAHCCRLPPVIGLHHHHHRRRRRLLAAACRREAVGWRRPEAEGRSQRRFCEPFRHPAMGQKQEVDLREPEGSQSRLFQVYPACEGEHLSTVRYASTLDIGLIWGLLLSSPLPRLGLWRAWCLQARPPCPASCSCSLCRWKRYGMIRSFAQAWLAAL